MRRGAWVASVTKHKNCKRVRIFNSLQFAVPLYHRGREELKPRLISPIEQSAHGKLIESILRLKRSSFFHAFPSFVPGENIL